MKCTGEYKLFSRMSSDDKEILNKVSTVCIQHLSALLRRKYTKINVYAQHISLRKTNQKSVQIFKICSLIIVAPLLSLSSPSLERVVSSLVAVLSMLGGEGRNTSSCVSCSCPSAPGIFEATQKYGSSLGRAVMVTDLFLVPLVLFHSVCVRAATFAEACRKNRSILGKYSWTEQVMFNAESVTILQSFFISCLPGLFSHVLMIGKGTLGEAMDQKNTLYNNTPRTFNQLHLHTNF